MVDTFNKEVRYHHLCSYGLCALSTFQQHCSFGTLQIGRCH